MKDKRYYIPFNSLNLNNILSSESISPSAFYEKRGFGFRRFERIGQNPFTNSLLAYSELPLSSIHKTEREEYLMLLAVPERYLRIEKSHIVDKIEIIQLKSTVYINWIDCFFVITDENLFERITAGTKRSLEVKHAEKYLSSFQSAQNNVGFNWSEDIIEGISDFKTIDSEGINFDQRFNKIKGLVYGFASGLLRAQSNELTAGKRYFQDFINTYSGLMNELSSISSSKNKGLFDSKRVDDDIKKLQDLRDRIDILLGANESTEVSQAIQQTFGIESEAFEQLSSYKYKKSKVTIQSLVIEFIKNKQKELYTVNELLDQLIANIKNFLRYKNQYSYKKMEDDFSVVRSLVSDKISNFQKIERRDNTLTHIPLIVNETSKVSSKCQNLTENENVVFSIILNELLSRLEMSVSDEIAQQRLDIIKGVGESVNEIAQKNSSQERDYLLRLYKSLKTVGVGFKPYESENKALQSFACFLTRFSELEKFQDYLDKNGIQDYSLAYSCWGASYGYSNLSKIMISPIESDEKSLQEILIYLYSILELQPPQKLEIKESNDKEISKTVVWQIDPKSEKTKPINFEAELIKLKGFKNKPDWIDAVLSCFQEVEDSAETDGGLFSNIDYRVDNFKDLLMNRTKRIKGFGKAKVIEVTKTFSEYKKNKI